MKIKLILIFLALLFLEFAKASEIHNVINCEIYTMEGKLIRKFPGRICIFMDDGTLLSAEEEKLVYYDKLRNVIWSKEIHPHHQINLTADKNEFLVLGSQIKEIKKDKVRYDVLYKINRKGDVVSSFNLFDNQSQFDKASWGKAYKRRFAKIGFSEFYQKMDWEITHTNSFYEIPENKISGHNSAFKKGNFIANDLSLMMVFVLASDLKTILWQSPLIKEEWTMFHDVQVVPGSESLVFYDNGSPLRPTTRLVEYDLSNDKIKWQYPEKLVKDFYSKKMGGIQLLANGNILFNDVTGIPVAHEISKDGKIIWSLTPRGDYASKDTKEPFQQIKRWDLTEFLKNHRGL